MILRDFQQIIAEILRSAQVSQGIAKTSMTREVQISFTQIKEYLQYLQQYELVSHDIQKSVYKTTMKGNRFLKLYDEMTELAPRRRIENSDA